MDSTFVRMILSVRYQPPKIHALKHIVYFKYHAVKHLIKRQWDLKCKCLVATVDIDILIYTFYMEWDILIR